MAKNLDMTLLLDIYGAVLTDRQQDIMRLYYDDDLSLGEIAEETGITRQGAFGCIKKAEAHLFELENRLELAERFKRLRGCVKELEEIAGDMDISERRGFNEKLKEIKSII